MAVKIFTVANFELVWKTIKEKFATKAELAKKVDKVDGLGLSENSYTTAEKTKLEGIAAGAQVNTLEGITVNGTAVAATDKVVDITVPTKVSTLANDAGYLVESDVAEAIEGKVDKVDGMSLTHNDLTDELKSKYDTTARKVEDLVETGGEPNKIDSITVNGVAAEPDVNKNVAITIPTKVSAFENDAKYLVAKDIEGKVDKVEGKGLSTEDYTTEEKTKLAGVAAGAQVNVLETVKVNGEALTADTDKAVNIDLSAYAKSADVVAKEDGKGLSTNDYADADKEKLAGIAEGAQVNVIESVKVNGTALTVADKAVDIAVPTKVSQLTNDSDFQSADEVSAAITNAVKDITSFEYEIVDALPAEGVKGKIYLVAVTGGKGQNIYEEYIFVNGKYEMLGTTEMDLSGYWSKADFEIATNADIEAIINAE